MTRGARHIKRQRVLKLLDIQDGGGTVEECFEYLLNDLAEHRELSGTLAAAGLSRNAGRRTKDGQGSLSLYSAMRIADVIGLKLVLEVDE